MNRLSGYQTPQDYKDHHEKSQPRVSAEEGKRLSTVVESFQVGGGGSESCAETASTHRYSRSVKKNIVRRIGRAFKTAISSLIEAIGKTFSSLVGATSRAGQMAKHGGEIDEKEERISSFEMNLEKNLIPYSSKMDVISSTHTNLMDVYTLTVGEGETSKEVAEAFLSALEKSEENHYKSFVFKGVNREVSLYNQKTLMVLHDRLKKEEFREALVSCLEVKIADKNNTIHILPPIQEAIDSLMDEDQAKVIGKYLMGEICTTGGGVRSFELPQLYMILNHEQVKNSPLLKRGVLIGAREVIGRAIQKGQSNALRSLIFCCHLSNGELKQVKERIFDFEASLERGEGKIDRRGLELKAKEFGLAAGIKNDDIQKRLDQLDQFIEIQSKISQLIDEMND